MCSPARVVVIITLGGRAGAGKTTVGGELARRLGYKFYSAGDVRRKYAIEQGLTIAELNKRGETDPTSDKLVDDYLRTIGLTENDIVADARLGFFFIPHSIKVFFVAEDIVRAKRTFEKARPEERPESLEDALRLLDQREESDAIRYHNLYGVHPFDTRRFDILIDTSRRTVDQTTEIIYNYIQSPVPNRKKLY